jgi:hypothetical protein
MIIHLQVVGRAGHTKDSNLSPPDYELDTLIKEVASLRLDRLLYIAPSSTALVLHLGK